MNNTRYRRYNHHRDHHNHHHYRRRRRRRYRRHQEGRVLILDGIDKAERNVCSMSLPPLAAFTLILTINLTLANTRASSLAFTFPLPFRLPFPFTLGASHVEQLTREPRNGRFLVDPSRYDALGLGEAGNHEHDLVRVRCVIGDNKLQTKNACTY